MPTPPLIPDRRPITARAWGVSTTLTNLCITVGLSPNQISMLGAACGIAGGIALFLTPYTEHPRALWLAAAIFTPLRLVANMLDGMVAIATRTTSPVGELYNDIPDRISDSCSLVGLGYALGGSPELGFTAALLAMLTAYIRAVGKGAAAGSDFRGPMAKQHRMACVTLFALFEAVAPASWSFSWGPRSQWGPAAAILALIITGCIITCLRRLSGISARLRTLPA